ncbi:unnamed protein product [Cylicostephanus goldi]|uniref:Uncharacterized protein n=1 Tax=Cylicostephanus goldi TaxID=71465 RepID=A0A3P6SXF2_CYLGO|nr:unnamed protein product [Cylicostephanus goldi]
MKCADVIIPRGGENDVAIELIVQHIQNAKNTTQLSPFRFQQVEQAPANGEREECLSDPGVYA